MAVSISTDDVLRSIRYRRWQSLEAVPVQTAVVEGKRPFRRGRLSSYLRDCGVTAKRLGELDAPDLLVVGRTGCDWDRLAKFVESRRGERLRVCSQEMTLTWALTGVDPSADVKTAETFIDGHPVLEKIVSLLEGTWPTTGRIPKDPSGEYDLDDVPKKGPLRRLGYQVGKHGASVNRRRRALEKAVRLSKKDLPGTYPESYLNEWGPSQSSRRLQKIANSIASNCRTRRSQPDKYEAAIADWEADLKWLRDTFYSPLTFSFEWPASS